MMDLIKTMFQSLENFIVPFLVRNILKIGGTFLAYAGWSESDVTFIVAGIVAMIFGFIMSLIRDKILKTK